MTVNEQATRPDGLAEHATSPVRRVFYVLSTGRCGTRFIATLLGLAENALVLHQPPPGGESINPTAYEWFVADRQRFDAMQADDFPLLREHAELYRDAAKPVFGDCYNAFYPFAVPLYRFFRQQGVEARFIHLIRHPVPCCSSILRAEGPYGEEVLRNFALRAPRLMRSRVPAEAACEIWCGINELIRYDMERLEALEPGVGRFVRLEDLRDVDYARGIFSWLGLSQPSESAIRGVMNDRSDGVRHSHQASHDRMGVPPISPEEVEIIRDRTAAHLTRYGYGPGWQPS